MSTLTVRNLDEDLVRRLRIRAAEKGRSAEAEHREILRDALAPQDTPITLAEKLARLEEFRRATAGRGGPTSTELLRESREMRMQQLSPLPE